MTGRAREHPTTTASQVPVRRHTRVSATHVIAQCLAAGTIGAMADADQITARCRHCATVIVWDNDTMWVHADGSVGLCAVAGSDVAEPCDGDGRCGSCAETIMLDEYGLWHHTADDRVICGFDPVQWASPKRTNGGTIDWEAAGVIVDRVEAAAAD